jgi:hypothetical protein
MSEPPWDIRRVYTVILAHLAPGDTTSATRVCVSRGASIELVLDRRRENRSQFVLTPAKGRPVILGQSARTTKQARPNVREDAHSAT